MTKKKMFSVDDWEKIEAEKKAKLLAVENEIEELQVARGNLIAEAITDETAFEKIGKIEKLVHELKSEYDLIKTLLEMIPGRKNYARSFDVDANAMQVMAIYEQMPVLISEIEKADNAYILSVKAYHDSIDSLQHYGIFLEPNDRGLAVHEAHSFNIKKHNMQRWMKYDFINGEPLLSVLERNPVLVKIKARVYAMQEHAKYLRGEIQGPKYCEHCFGKLRKQENQLVCASCGKSA